MKSADFDYDLPEELIAQTPAEPRDSSRLLVLKRETGALEHAIFRDLGRYLNKGDMLVLNETQVIPARLFAHKIPTGGKVEILLVRRQNEYLWEALVGGKGLKIGKRLQVVNGPAAVVSAVLDGSRRLIQFDEPVEDQLSLAGHTPLPPYIHTPLDRPERYQTVYARQPGSVAAPTAGLHFTDDLMQSLGFQGIKQVKVNLHVGLDTFAPVTEENPNDHKIHTEWCQVTSEAARRINETAASGKRVIAVGTTCVRTLESAHQFAKAGEIVGAFEGQTDLFILPGTTFSVVRGMITNFHLPRSSLIMLVSAFAGRERLLQAYETAKKAGYRFYSFGDAMLIL